MYRWSNIDENQINTHYSKLKRKKFPIPHYNTNEIDKKIQEFNKYVNKEPNLKSGNVIRRSFHGSAIIHQYHPHRWTERTSEDVSMVDAWKDPYRLKRAIRLTIADGKEPSHVNVGKSFRKYKLGRSPAFFSPAQSRSVITSYSKPGDTVVDPFVGYGGSIPAAVDRKFIGIDISSPSIRGNRRMVRDLTRNLQIPKGHIKLIKEDSRKALHSLPANSADLIYTSPPYYNRELYKGNGQSHQIDSYHKWLSEFYVPSLHGMHRITKKGGHVVINIAPVKETGKLKYPLDEHTISLAKDMGLRLIDRKKLSLGIYRRGVTGKTLTDQKNEPILVFKKTGNADMEKAKLRVNKLLSKPNI
jgi:DNA modification methylase